MTYKVFRTDLAERDLDSILNYIALILANPKAAADLLDQYSSKLAVLSKTPQIYPLSRIQKLSGMGLRSFVFGNYIAFFKIDDEDKAVTISRVFYQRPETRNA